MDEAKFTAGLRMPYQDFIEEILKAYDIEMHHLTPNGIAKIALFVWVVNLKKQIWILELFAIFMRCILSLETRRWMAKLLSNTLVAVVLSLLEVPSRFHRFPRISGLKIGIDTGFTIQFLLFKKETIQGKL